GWGTSQPQARDGKSLMATPSLDIRYQRLEPLSPCQSQGARSDKESREPEHSVIARIRQSDAVGQAYLPRLHRPLDLLGEKATQRLHVHRGDMALVLIDKD